MRPSLASRRQTAGDDSSNAVPQRAPFLPVETHCVSNPLALGPNSLIRLKPLARKAMKLIEVDGDTSAGTTGDFRSDRRSFYEFLGCTLPYKWQEVVTTIAEKEPKTDDAAQPKSLPKGVWVPTREDSSFLPVAIAMQGDGVRTGPQGCQDSIFNQYHSSVIHCGTHKVDVVALRLELEKQIRGVVSTITQAAQQTEEEARQRLLQKARADAIVANSDRATAAASTANKGKEPNAIKASKGVVPAINKRGPLAEVSFLVTITCGGPCSKAGSEDANHLFAVLAELIAFRNFQRVVLGNGSFVADDEDEEEDQSVRGGKKKPRGKNDKKNGKEVEKKDSGSSKRNRGITFNLRTLLIVDDRLTLNRLNGLLQQQPLASDCHLRTFDLQPTNASVFSAILYEVTQRFPFILTKKALDVLRRAWTAASRLSDVVIAIHTLLMPHKFLNLHDAATVKAFPPVPDFSDVPTKLGQKSPALLSFQRSAEAAPPATCSSPLLAESWNAHNIELVLAFRRHARRSVEAAATAANIAMSYVAEANAYATLYCAFVDGRQDLLTNLISDPKHSELAGVLRSHGGHVLLLGTDRSYDFKSEKALPLVPSQNPEKIEENAEDHNEDDGVSDPLPTSANTLLFSELSCPRCNVGEEIVDVVLGVLHPPGRSAQELWHEASRKRPREGDDNEGAGDEADPGHDAAPQFNFFSQNVSDASRVLYAIRASGGAVNAVHFEHVRDRFCAKMDERRFAVALRELKQAGLVIFNATRKTLRLTVR